MLIISAEKMKTKNERAMQQNNKSKANKDRKELREQNLSWKGES